MSREQSLVAPDRRVQPSRALPSWTLAVFVAATAIAVGGLVAFSPSLAFGAALFVPLVLVSIRRSGSVAVLLLLWGGVKYGAIQRIPALSGSLAQAEFAIVVLLLLLAIMKLSRREVGNSVSLGPYLLLAAFIGLSFLSWALNAGTVLGLIAGLRSLVTMPILALATVVNATESDMTMLKKGVVLLTFLQVPVAIAQFLIGGLSANVDLVNGTLGLGGSNLLGMWMLAAFSASFYVFVRRGGVKWLAAALAFTGVIVASGARLSIIGVPVALLILAMVAISRRHEGDVSVRLVTSLLVVSIAGVLAVGVVYAGYARGGVRIGTALEDLNPASLLQRQSQIGDYSVPRLAYVTYGWQYLQSRSRFPLLGTGPATAGSGSAQAASQDYESTPFAVGLRIQGQGLATYASIAQVVTVTSQFASSLVEYGPVGLALFLAFYVVVGVRGIRALWRRPDPSLIDEAALAALPVFLLFATVGTVYGVTWEGLNIVGLGMWWGVIISGALLTTARRAEAVRVSSP